MTAPYFQNEPLELAQVQRKELEDTICASYSLSKGYILLVICSSQIALFGLLTNSPAVIIGAMLISPLMDPILGMGLALSRLNFRETLRGLITLSISVIAVGVLTVAVMAFSPLKDITGEVMARTKPNLFDLMVALFGALAGTWSLVHKPLSNTIPGVAIATALMPPLVTIFLGVSVGNMQIAKGASGLFFTNIATILFTAMVVFWVSGFRPEGFKKQFRARVTIWQFGVMLVLLLCLAWPLGIALKDGAEESRFNQKVKQIASSFFLERRKDAKVLGIEKQTPKDGPLQITLTVQTPKLFQHQATKDFQKKLEEEMGEELIVKLLQVPLLTEEQNPFVPAVLPNTQVSLAPSLKESAMVVANAENVFMDKLNAILFEENAECESVTFKFLQDGFFKAHCSLQTPIPIRASLKRELKEIVVNDLGLGSQLELSAKSQHWPLIALAPNYESNTLPAISCQEFDAVKKISGSIFIRGGEDNEVDELRPQLKTLVESCGLAVVSNQGVTTPEVQSGSFEIWGTSPKTWTQVIQN